MKFDEKMDHLTQKFGELEEEVLARHDGKQAPADDNHLSKEDVHKQQNALKSNATLAAFWELSPAAFVRCQPVTDWHLGVSAVVSPKGNHHHVLGKIF